MAVPLAPAAGFMEQRPGLRRITGKEGKTMARISMRWAALAALALAMGVTGCMVHVDKDANGKDKHVRVDTPFGGVHVNTNQTTVSDLGLPVYPGAKLGKGNDDNQSADVHLGFGEWELHVRTVSYESSDSQQKVTEFYKKALGRYGDVITCQWNQPVGTPTATHEGLTCNDDDKNSKVHIGNQNSGIDKGSLELKAGSKRHQHIVGFEENSNGQTRFSLVALDLPSEVESGSGKSD